MATLNIPGIKTRLAKPIHTLTANLTIYRARKAHVEQIAKQRKYATAKLANQLAPRPVRSFNPWWHEQDEAVLWASKYGKRQIFPAPTPDANGFVDYAESTNLSAFLDDLKTYEQFVNAGGLDAALEATITKRGPKKSEPQPQATQIAA